MNLTESVALVTGANRGLGARLVTELLRAGAAKVYAANYLGTLRVTRSFAPALERNAPAAVVNVLTLIALAPPVRWPATARPRPPPTPSPGPCAPKVVAERIIAALAAGETIVFPDDTSVGAGSVYLSDPVKLEHLLAG